MSAIELWLWIPVWVVGVAALILGIRADVRATRAARPILGPNETTGRWVSLETHTFDDSSGGSK